MGSMYWFVLSSTSCRSSSDQIGQDLHDGREVTEIMYNFWKPVTPIKMDEIFFTQMTFSIRSSCLKESYYDWKMNYPITIAICKYPAWHRILNSFEIACECWGTWLMIRQHWSRQWLAALLHQAITCTNVDQVLWCHMVLHEANQT